MGNANTMGVETIGADTVDAVMMKMDAIGAENPPAANHDYFVFHHGRLQFGVDVRAVAEIVMVDEIVASHGTIDSCFGNLVHRGKLVPVFDVTAFTTKVAKRLSPEMVVVINCEDVVAGFSLDKYVAVHSFHDEPPATHASSILSGPFAETSPAIELVRGFLGQSLGILSTKNIADMLRMQVGDQEISELEESEFSTEDDKKSDATSDSRTFMCASVEGTVFAIPVEDVIEVIEGLDVTPLFNVPQFLRGVTSLRGKVLACVDISHMMGVRPRLLDERSKFVILQHDDIEMTFCVDDVSRLKQLYTDRAQKTDAVLVGEINVYVDGVLEEEDETIFLLSTQALFDSPHLETFRSEDG
ncbi:MAG: chemotaxis protein CheW [Planctomycetota bacterium]|nr:chemotaxis protein CheW [Planctomycetota bacterium]